MKLVIFTALLFVTLCVAFAQHIYLPPDMTIHKLEQNSDGKTQELFSKSELVSAKRAFFQSLLLPGWGEFYAGSKVKSIAFFGTEIALWAGFAYFLNQYYVKTDEYQKFADQHWSETYWRVWYDSICSLADTNDIGTEHLPSEKTQQYYEMIGKYDWFSLGWDDIIYKEGGNREFLTQRTYEIAGSSPGRPDTIFSRIVLFFQDSAVSGNREKYMNMRKKANDQFTYAKYFVGVAIANHLLSAFDAAWTAKRHNDKYYEGFSGVQAVEVKARITMIDRKPVPFLTCTMRW